jgi:hypothetical protein
MSFIRMRWIFSFSHKIISQKGITNALVIKKIHAEQAQVKNHYGFEHRIIT